MFYECNALLLFYFKVDGENMYLGEWAEITSKLFYALEFNAKYQSTNGTFII